VIGNTAIGVGSNSVVLGNDNITKSILKGNVGIGTTNPGALLDVAGNIRSTTGSLQIGNATNVTYSRFGTATATWVNAANDVLISGNEELKGTLYLDNGQINNVGGSATITFPSSPSTTANALTAGNWLVDNTLNLGQAALIIKQRMGGDLMTASASGTPEFTIHNDSSFTMAGTATAPTSFTTAGTVYFNTATTAVNGTTTGDLFLRGEDNNWHRVALDMTQYSVTNATVGTGATITVTHNQNTNDISATGWVYDTVSGLWTTISNFSNQIINALDNTFNPSFTEKAKTSAIALNNTYIYGTGADGAVGIGATVNINTVTSISGRSASCGDATMFIVTALTSTTATVSSNPTTNSCLAVGDEVLLINLQGTSTATANVGNWETLRVSSLTSTTVTFTTAKTKYYGDNLGDDTNIGTTVNTTQRVMLQRVPNYTNVTVSGAFTASAWSSTSATGGIGGVMFFRATGTVTVGTGTTISVNGLGYTGGLGGANDNPSDGGESYCGSGGGGGADYNGTPVGTVGICGGGGGGGVNGATGYNANVAGSAVGGSGGGGGSAGSTGTNGYGYGGGGAGGGYGTVGAGGKAGNTPTSDGASGSGSTSGNGGSAGVGATNPVYAGGGGGGGTYGDTYLDKLFLGTGGGGGGAGDTATTGYTAGNGGAGGNGGGIMVIAAATISVTSTGRIQSNGAAGSATLSTTYAGSGGGGTGGSIKIIADTVTTSTTDLITASGGLGDTTADDGGNGGVGRIAVSYKNTLTANASEPDYPTSPYLHQSGYYGIYVSKEINTPGATSYSTLNWTETLNTYGQTEVQTRTGATADSTDGTWEGWKPVGVGNTVTLDAMDATTGWSTGNGLSVASGDITRNVNYFEDENLNSTQVTNTLKFGSVGTATGYSEKTISSKNLTDFNLISAWVYATASSEIKLGFGEAAATEQEETIKVDATSTWQKVYWDISDVANGNKDGVTKVRVTVLSPNNTVYVDNIQAEKFKSAIGDASISVASTAANYFQYRFILSTTDPQYDPSVSGVSLTYSDGTSHTIDASSIRLTNSPTYYSSSHLTVTESALDDTKSYQVNKGLTSVSQTGDYNPGTGADGDITVSGDTNYNTGTLIAGRSCADGGDATNYSVSVLTSTTATLTSNPSTGCLNAGDEVLLINLMGATTTYTNLGNYETLRVASVAGNVVTFATAKTKFYGNGAGDDLNLGTTEGTQRVMLQRVPNYRNVTVNASQHFYPSTWNGVKGGVMFFRATGTVTVAGSINADGLGYRGFTFGGNADQAAAGGESFCTYNAGGSGGEYSGSTASTAGICGGGGGGSNGYTGSAGSNTGGAGGGGGGFYTASGYARDAGGGGGGGYGSAGSGGQAVDNAGINGGTNISGAGGDSTVTANEGGGGGGGTYGTSYSDLSRLFFGSAGGAGGSGESSGASHYVGGDGGGGGGIVMIATNTLSVSGTISSNGGGGGTANATYGGGGGGGAGGSVKILGGNLTLGSNLVSATHGTGGTANENGGNGGDGRIATYYAVSRTGTITSPAEQTAQVAAYNYSVFISDEIPTPAASSYSVIKWLADLQSYGQIEFQTRSGKSNNSTNGTWEGWKPVGVGNTLTLNDMNTVANWTGTVFNLNTPVDGQLARNVNYFEDEDITNAANQSVKFGSVGASNGYAEATISKDLTNYDYLTAWVYATGSGNLVKLGFGESAATENEKTFFIASANTWQKIYWDITDINTTLRNGVTKLRVSIPSTNTTVYVDNITADRYLTNSAGSTITSTPNDYIQYRAILTTTNTAYHPALYNVQIVWNNGFKIVQTDANTVKLYNNTGSTQQLRLDVVVFGADLAEWYTVGDQTIGAGDVVALTGQMDENGVPILEKAQSQNDPNLIGIISTNAGQTLGIQADNRRLLALAGRVPVKIDPASPAISVGDGITSSATPGYARKASFGDTVVAKAVQSWNSEQAGELFVIVNNSNSVSTYLTSIQDYQLIKDAVTGTWQVVDQGTQEVVKNAGVFADLIASNIKAGSIITQDFVSQNFNAAVATVQKLTTNSLAVKLISPVPGETNVTVQIGSEATPSGQFVIQNASGSAVAAIDNQGNATFSGTVNSRELSVNSASIAGELHAGTIYAGQIITDNELPTDPADLQKIKDLLAQVDTDQNILKQLQSWTPAAASGSASFIGQELATNNLYVTGQAAINSLSVTNSMTVGTDLVFSSIVNSQQLTVNSIDTLSAPLSIQSLAMAPIEMMAGLIKIDTKGNVQISGDLFVAGRITSSGLTLSEINNQESATESANLLSLKDANGNEVSSVNASGSAEFNNLATQGLTIAGAINATAGAVINGVITTNATAGSATIPSGISEITIKNPKVTDYTLVYVTPTSTTENYVLYVKSKQAGQFTVGFTNPIDIDVYFNWWIIQAQ